MVKLQLMISYRAVRTKSKYRRKLVGEYEDYTVHLKRGRNRIWTFSLRYRNRFVASSYMGWAVSKNLNQIKRWVEKFIREHEEKRRLTEKD